MKFKGKILHISEVQLVGAKKFEKVEFVLEEIGAEYPNSICLTIFGRERVGMIAEFNVGDIVSVLYNTKATEYNGKWFTNSTVWKMMKSKNEIDEAMGDDGSDLPF